MNQIEKNDGLLKLSGGSGTLGATIGVSIQMITLAEDFEWQGESRWNGARLTADTAFKDADTTFNLRLKFGNFKETK